MEMLTYCEQLLAGKKFIVANQLLRSAVSIGANVFEAQHAESRMDFIHKMKIAAKEANETKYWLILCERSDGYFFEERYRADLEAIIRILSGIIISAKKNIKRIKKE